MASLKEALEERRERILVVDDVRETAEVIQRNLEREGYDVVAASGVDEAIRMLREFPVDLVITDMKMPGASVLTLLRYLQKSCSRTPVILVSGYPISGAEDEIVRAGVQEYIPKPFTDDELLSAVRGVMKNLKEAVSDSGPGRKGR
jgi:two-component system response regulator HydG